MYIICIYKTKVYIYILLITKETEIMETLKRISNSQVLEIAKTVNNRWRFVNSGSYYNCIDTKTGQQSIQGGKYNFASYYFHNEVEKIYLKMIEENNLYFCYQTHSVKEQKERYSYLYQIKMKVVEILCGFTVVKNKSLITA